MKKPEREIGGDRINKKKQKNFFSENTQVSLSNPMSVRNRRAPTRLLPSPILVRPTKKRKYERPRIYQIQEGPPWIQASVSKTAEFLFNHFGNSMFLFMFALLGIKDPNREVYELERFMNDK